MPSQLLIAYESGVMCLWDMRGKMAEMRWQSAQPLRSISWHYEGKHFASSHTDGSLCTWPLRPTPMPLYHNYPHGELLLLLWCECCVEGGGILTTTPPCHVCWALIIM